MGLIVTFPPPGRAQMRRNAPPPGNADILFFTGVRYARRDGSPGAGENGTRQKSDRRPRRRKARA